MWEVDMNISEIRDHLDAESVARMDEFMKAAGRATEASYRLSRISGKLDAISSFFVCESEGMEIKFEGSETFGFAFIIQDLAQEIKVIADRLEGVSDNE
jgi:hypothetical protein